MSAAGEQAAKVGRRAFYINKDKGGMRFIVKVEDVRYAYGRTDYLIIPETGDGQAWVSEWALNFIEESA